MNEPTPPPDINDLLIGIQERQQTVNAKNATKGSGGVFDTIGELHRQDYTPELLTAGTAVGAGAYLTGKTKKVYLEELNRVRAAIEKERKLVSSLRNGAQPFEDKGVKITNQNKPAVQATRKLKSGNIALKPFETGATSQVSPIRGASNPKPILRGGFAGIPAQPAVESGAAWLARPAVEGKPAIPPFLDRSVAALKPTEQAQLAKELTKARMTRFLPLVGEPYAPMAEPLNDVRAEGVATRGKASTRPSIQVKASEVKSGKPTIPPKKAIMEAGKTALNLGQKALGKVSDAWNSPWVQRPLMLVDIGATAMGIPQAYRNEEALMAAEAAGTADISRPSILRNLMGQSDYRPLFAAAGRPLRTATNIGTRYIPELLGMYDMGDKLGDMNVNIIKREMSDFEKKNGRPMNEQEANALLDAISMTGISIGG